MIKVTLTGKIRYRVQPQIFRKPLVVLQVQQHFKGYQVDDAMGSGHDVDHDEWRDADVEALSTIWISKELTP